MRRMLFVVLQIGYVLIDACRILKDVSVVPYFSSRSDYHIFRERIHIIPALEKRVLNMSNRRKRSTKIDEELLLQVEATDWRMAANIKEDNQCFTEKVLQYAKKPEHAQPSRIDSWFFEATKDLLERRKAIKRDNIRIVEHSILCGFIRRRLQAQDLTNYKGRRLVTAAE